MGDNHIRSEDSRYWGLYPKSHIMSKPPLFYMDELGH
jgi:type IV secretory pathway protease TraF